jgi:DNA topoisomerase-1
MNLVIVESPSKAKIINKYLGKDYNVIASFGHIRQLPSKKGSVEPDKDFLMHFQVPPASDKHVNNIVNAAKKATSIILATDPDREGEAISWHVIEVLREKKIIDEKFPIKRIAFSEISKKSVNDAIKNPRNVDLALVEAQKARQALDYLVGFTLSPLLWKRLPSCKSAGRVQSVALRLICEREEQIEKFISEEFWDITINFLSSGNEKFQSKLTHINGEKLEKFSIKDSSTANQIANDIKLNEFFVSSIEKKKQKRNPYPPFITSTLQQEAARKLGFTAKKTMQVAQKLYEGISVEGEVTSLITYMRTDGVTLSSDAINSARSYIESNLGKKYLPKEPNIYVSKTKNAQEAHEAIRPVNITITPKDLQGKIENDFYKLYDLIWKRTVVCQMSPVEIDIVIANIASINSKYLSKSTGSTIVFDGFYKIYKEEASDDQKDDSQNILPPLAENEKLELISPESCQHFTEAPPRYNEASLIKKLEELGIGRPSTYASLISVIQDRNYVKLEKKRFYPDERGRILNAFLVAYFTKYVEYNFTASLEDDLDKIASNELKWKDLLKSFWQDFYQTIELTSERDSKSIIETVENALEYHLFPKKEGNDTRKCIECADGILGLKLGKFGAFLACSNYPVCKHTKQIIEQELLEKENSEKNQDNILILGKEDNLDITLRQGPYGPYIQKGEAEGKLKPKRVSIPPFLKDKPIDFTIAKQLLSLPILIGLHPEDKKEIKIGIGKFGPYIHHDSKFTAIPKAYSAFEIKIENAIEIIESKKNKRPKNVKSS